MSIAKSFCVVIVGRPNVGKSTLFNRLYGKKRALVHDLPGVTRDRLIENTEWKQGEAESHVRLVDTGGLGGDRFADEIAAQVKAALSEAHVVLMVLDAQQGITPQDREVLRGLRQGGLDGRKIPILGVVNKVDVEKHEAALHDFYELGLDELLTVSAEHGRGIDDLKSRIFEVAPVPAFREAPPEEPFPEDLSAEEDALEGELDEAGEETEEPARVRGVPRIAIVGRPNVGKSTLINAILGEKRMITSPIAGTTVDSIDSEAEIGGRPLVLIDTAGIRRKNKTEQGVEVLSVIQTKKALERCDLAILVLDGEEGITEQDEKIGGMIEEQGCSVILALNKWDTQQGKKDFTRDDAAELIRKKIAFLRYAPLLFLSARRGQGFQGLGELIEEILDQREVKPTTKEFTEWVRQTATIHNPYNAKFYLCHQASRTPPTFVCHVSDPEKIHFSLKRHLVNGIRARWGYMGSPIRLIFRKGGARKKA
jgi:GTP-binding protein